MPGWHIPQQMIRGCDDKLVCLKNDMWTLQALSAQGNQPVTSHPSIVRNHRYLGYMQATIAVFR